MSLLRSHRWIARRLAAFALLAVAGAAAPLAAQSTATAPACFGFSFGRWTPALNWRASGHGERPDSTRHLRAPTGRDWAVNGLPGDADTRILLFPGWWPAGIGVELPTREPAVGDTIVGLARAFVADGRVAVPTAPVRAWRVVCGEGRGR